ncbi:MAG: hypothetical protein AAF800_04590 [Planctomycetota bacterium]
MSKRIVNSLFPHADRGSLIHRETAKFLGICERTLSDYREELVIPRIRIGDKLMIPTVDLWGWLHKRAD